MTTVVLVLVGQAKNTSTGPSMLSSLLKLIFGVLLLLVGVKERQGRRRHDDRRQSPVGRW